MLQVIRDLIKVERTLAAMTQTLSISLRTMTNVREVANLKTLPSTHQKRRPYNFEILINPSKMPIDDSTPL